MLSVVTRCLCVYGYRRTIEGQDLVVWMKLPEAKEACVRIAAQNKCYAN